MTSMSDHHIIHKFKIKICIYKLRKNAYRILVFELGRKIRSFETN